MAEMIRKKDTAKESYELILKKVLEVKGIDERHQKDVLKVLLRLFSHFSDPMLDEDLTKEAPRCFTWVAQNRAYQL